MIGSESQLFQYKVDIILHRNKDDPYMVFDPCAYYRSCCVVLLWTVLHASETLNIHPFSSVLSYHLQKGTNIGSFGCFDILHSSLEKGGLELAFKPFYNFKKLSCICLVECENHSSFIFVEEARWRDGNVSEI